MPLAVGELLASPKSVGSSDPLPTQLFIDQQNDSVGMGIPSLRQRALA